MQFVKAFGAMRAGERNKLKALIKRHKECLKWASSFGVSKQELKQSFRHEVATSFHTVVTDHEGNTYQAH